MSCIDDSDPGDFAAALSGDQKTTKFGGFGAPLSSPSPGVDAIRGAAVAPLGGKGGEFDDSEAGCSPSPSGEELLLSSPFSHSSSLRALLMGPFLFSVVGPSSLFSVGPFLPFWVQRQGQGLMPFLLPVSHLKD